MECIFENCGALRSHAPIPPARTLPSLVKVLFRPATPLPTPSRQVQVIALKAAYIPNTASTAITLNALRREVEPS